MERAIIRTSTLPCDFCNQQVEFNTFGDPFTYNEAAIEGAGSDHLAIWCHECGPKHRDESWTRMTS